MNDMTITKPLEYITLGKIKYKVTPIQNLEHIQIVADFHSFLDRLDTEIYNEAVEEYAKHFNLKEFSDMIESDFIFDTTNLKQQILIFKQIVLETLQKRILDSCTLQDEIREDLGVKKEVSLKDRMNNALTDIYYIVKEAEDKGLTDTQEFINFEDALNYISCVEHPECKHEFQQESHIE